MHKYFPHTEHDLREMLQFLGLNSVKDLFQDVPSHVKFQGDYQIPLQMNEIELRAHFAKLASLNQTYTIFSGLGAYDHYEPSVIPFITSRQEFLTSYTPYQPEVAQGTLQYIFEYQSMICELTGMDVSNASMYDGPTSAAEAMFMAEAITKRPRMLVSSAIFPHIKEVLKTYAHYRGLAIDWIPTTNGHTDLSELKTLLTKEHAMVFVQKTNLFGVIEDYSHLGELVHANGSLLVIYADIATLALLKTPGEDQADIAVGDCQTLGIPIGFGGPYLGYMAVKKVHVRKMPGRICGLSYDKFGKRSFVLTLQAREQHIRREKANSNICSNQSLMALYITVYLTLLGPSGLKNVNELSYQGAHYLYRELLKTNKFEVAFDQPFFKEFTLKSLIPAPLMQSALQKAGFFGAYPLVEIDPELENLYNFAVTEKRTKAEIDALVQVLGGLSW